MSSNRAALAAILKTLAAEPYCCEVSRTGSGHWKVRRPGHGTITIGSTVNGRHIVKTVRADVRRSLGITL